MIAPSELCRVVLVRPTIPGNLGATARVMRNFGLCDLWLVQPHADPSDEQARKQSTRGEFILDNARSVADLGDAVAECVCVVGTSARVGGAFRRQNVHTPRELMPNLAALAAARGPLAFVFGTEASGLTDAEVTRCHYLLTIPTDAAYPALNLAQAVAITLYEFHLATVSSEANCQPRDVAAFESQERMFARLESALRDLHFLWGDNAATLQHALRHLIGRAQPSPMECDLLTGLARQIEWFVKKRTPDSGSPAETA